MLQDKTKLRVSIAINDIKVKKGNIYVAPGDRHLMISEDHKIILDDGPKVNFVRPSSDILFNSLAKAFSNYIIFHCNAKGLCVILIRLSKK